MAARFPTGLVRTGPNGAVVEGGEDASLAVDAIRGQEGIFVGSISTSGTVSYPTATIAAWDEFIATATATVLSSRSNHAHVEKRSGALSASVGASFGLALVAAAFVMSLALA